MTDGHEPPRITRADAVKRLGVSDRHFLRVATAHHVFPVGKLKNGKAQANLYTLESIEYLEAQRPEIRHASDTPGQRQPAPDTPLEHGHNGTGETHPAKATDGHAATLLAQAVAALSTELAASHERESRILAERDAERTRANAAEAKTEAIRADLLAEIQRERDGRLRAEWEAAQRRPLTAPPDLPEPKRRRRFLLW